MARRKLDNLDKDVIRAERLGYGCHYGRYKADHPYTRDVEPEVEIPENVKKLVCNRCGMVYYPRLIGRSTRSRYCSNECTLRPQDKGRLR